MTDFPVVLTTAVDNTTDALAKHLNNLETKVGVDDSAVTTSLDYRSKVLMPLQSLARQAIINGNFDVWQRGTSFSGAANADYTADRWAVAKAGSSTVDVTQETFTLGQTDVPLEPAYYVSNDVTSNSAASDFIALSQKIESVRSFAGQSVTISFYAKAGSALDLSIEVYQNFGTGGSPSTAVSADVEKITLTTSWAKYSVTLAVDSITGKTVGTTDDGYLLILLWFDAGSNYNVRTDSLGNQTGVFDISQVQLCAGSVALPFQPKSLGQELADCQRYYIQDGIDTEYPLTFISTTTTNAWGRCTFPVTMRAIPTVVLYRDSAANTADEFGIGNKTGVTASGITSQGFSRITTSSTWSDNAAIRFGYIATSEL